MIRRRVFAMALAVTLMVQSMGTSAYAAGQSEVSQTAVEDNAVTDAVAESTTEEVSVSFAETVNEEDVSVEETSGERTTGEETTVEETSDAAVNGEIASEDPQEEEETPVETSVDETATESVETVEATETIASEEATTLETTTEAVISEETVTETELEIVLAENQITDNQSLNYVVDETKNIVLENVKANSKSYMVEIAAKKTSWGSLAESNYYLICTDDGNLGESFCPDVTSQEEENLETAGYTLIKSDALTTVNAGNTNLIKAMFCGEDGLKPNTQYYYRLAYREYDSSAAGSYRYYFLSVPYTFTTAEALTSSSVSFKNIQAKEIGHNCVNYVWEVDDPNGEISSKENIHLKFISADESDYTNADRDVASEDCYGMYDKEEGKYYARAYGSSQLKARVETTVFTGNGEKTLITSDEVTTTLKGLSEDEVTITESIGATSVAFDLKVLPWYKVDDYYVNMKIRTGEGNWKYGGSSSQWTDSGECNLLLDELTEETTYEYYITMQPRSSGADVVWSYGSAEAPKSFTTGKSTTYPDSTFPDEAFRNALKEKIGIEEDELISSGLLEPITSVSFERSRTDGEITSIEGIQYLTNLQSVDFGEQGIQDASLLGGLKKVHTIWMDGNDLTTFPDLSNVSFLEYAFFEQNRLEAITEDKLPEKFVQNNPSWIAQTQRNQRGPFSYKLADTYYGNGDAYPFLIKVSGLKKTWIDYELTVTIGDNSTTATNLYVNEDEAILVMKDVTEGGITISPGTYSASIVLKDEYGREYLNAADVSLTFEKDETTASDVYIDALDTSCDVEMYIPKEIAQSDIVKYEITNQNNKVVGSCSNISAWYSTSVSDERYDDFAGMTYYSLYRTATRVSGTMEFPEGLSMGAYNILVTTTDGTTYTAKNAVHVTKDVVVNEISVDERYDQSGDYVYLAVKGRNLEPNHMVVNLYWNDLLITEHDKWMYGGSDLLVCRLLKKSDEWSQLNRSVIDVKVEAVDDIKLIDMRENGSISFAFDKMNILGGVYNHKNDCYEVKVGNVPEGTKVDVELESTAGLAYASDTVKDGKLNLIFYKEDGSKFGRYTDLQCDLLYTYVRNGIEEAVEQKYVKLKYLSFRITDDGTNPFVNDNDKEIYYAVRSNDYPATIQVYKPYETEVVKEIHITEPTADNMYYFTREDLGDLAWDNEVYWLVMNDETGRVYETMGYLGINTPPSVNVPDYSISKSELVFDLSGETISEKLTVNKGTSILTGITWSSSDISVATVDKNGKVTATGTGTATIMAAIKNGPVLTCNVTVERSKLEKIALSASAITLVKDKTEILKVYFVPNDATCDKTIVWTSEDDAIASVSANGIVNAKAKGETKIKATVKDTDISAECIVIVQDVVDESTLIVPSGLSALTNVDKTLADISLDAFAGWKWQNPDIDLTKFAGYQEKTFVAVYQPDEYTKAVYKEIPVKLSTVTGISLQAEQTKVLKDQKTNVALAWVFTGTEPDMSFYEDSIKWENSKATVADVGAGTTNVVVTALAKGSTTLKATVTVGEKAYSKTIKINVAEGSKADIQVTEVTGFSETAQGSAYFTADKTAVSEGMINGTAVNATKLTVKSSNAKVIAVKAAKVNEDGTFTIPYTVKAAGAAKITLTANDALKTTKEIRIQAKDVEPAVSVAAVTVNRLSENGESFFIYPGPDAAIKSVALTGTGSEKFDFAYNSATYKATLKTVDETVATGKQNVDLLITLKDDSTKNVTLTVNINEKKPTFKVKQAKKLNLFMKNTVEEAALTVTTSDKVTSITLNSECDFEIRENNNNYYVAAKADGLTTACKKNGVLSVTYANYRGTYTYNLKVAVERKAPKITANPTTAVLYPNVGIESANVSLYLNKEVLDLSDLQISMSGTTDYSVATNEDVVAITRTNTTQNKKIKANLVLACEEWVETVKVPVTLSVNMKTPKVKLSTKAVKLNSNPEFTVYDESAVRVMWKDSANFEPEKITVSAANTASQKVLNKEIVFVVDDNNVIVKQNGKAPAGTYSFKINVSTGNGYTASEKLTVKVKDTPLAKAMKVSAKGTIDVLNRDGSYVTVTPSLGAVNGNVVDAQVSGKFAHLFETPVVENGKIYLYVKDDAAVITKYNYSINLILTVENASGDQMEVESAELKVKFKQGKPKFTLHPKKEVFFSNAYNSVTVDIAATLKGAENPVITNVELVNNANAFDYGYDVETQKLTIIMKNNGEVVKGKKYSLQFTTSLKGQADNEKVNVVKYSVTVK